MKHAAGLAFLLLVPFAAVATPTLEAVRQVGVAYHYGGRSPETGFDCSGLVAHAFEEAWGVELPRTAQGLARVGKAVRFKDLRPGDLVFWGSSSSPESIHHVAMYIGGGQIIHAPRTGRPVVVESMYYWIPPNFFARV